MKKTITYNILFLLIFFGLIGSSCDNFFENEIASPNSPTLANPSLLTTNVQVAIFASYGGQLARQSGIMTQHLAGTSNGSQSIQLANYDITELTNGNSWAVIYTGIVHNANIIIENYGSDNPYYSGIAKICKAIGLSLASDLWGDVPFTEAGKGFKGTLTPVYDLQKNIYDETNSNSLFALLDSAITDLSHPPSANIYVPGSDDIIFKGNISKWISLAYSLKARFYNRLSGIDPKGSATKVLSILPKAISSSSENAILVFGTATTDQNQWGAFERDRGGYIKMGEYFIDLLKTNADPRLNYFADVNEDKVYLGTPKDNVDSLNTSSIGAYLTSTPSTIPIVSYVEMKFIEAEAEFRSANLSAAAVAYNIAVKESVKVVTTDTIASGSTFASSFASETSSSITLEKIMTQKYIALFGQIESYNDFRRTDIPSNIKPNPKAQISSIPVRLIIPQPERLYNPNSNDHTGKKLTDKVYWDVK